MGMKTAVSERGTSNVRVATVGSAIAKRTHIGWGKSVEKQADLL